MGNTEGSLGGRRCPTKSDRAGARLRARVAETGSDVAFASFSCAKTGVESNGEWLEMTGMELLRLRCTICGVLSRGGGDQRCS